MGFVDVLTESNRGYILFIIVIAYFANQYDRYVYTVAEIPFVDYNSYEYGVIVGPAFIIVYTVAGIFIGALSQAQRVLYLTLSMLFWATTVGLVSACTSFWQIALLRAGLGLGQSAFTPLATSILGDYFPLETRATAMGVYNVGIYAGYGISLGVGTFVNNLIGWRWSYLVGGFIGAGIASLLGLTVREPKKSKEEEEDGPEKDEENEQQAAAAAAGWEGGGGGGKGGEEEEEEGEPEGGGLRGVLRYWAGRPALLVLCVAGGVRNAGGYCWGNYTALFFSELFTRMPSQSETCSYSYSDTYTGSQVCDIDYPYCRSGTCERISSDPWHDIGLAASKFETFISLIPLLAGSCGAILGGIVADRIVKGRGPAARLYVAAGSCLLAAPCASAVLLAPYPWCFLGLAGAYIFGEMWIGVLLALVIELVPSAYSTTSIAVYLFIITNIGGNAPLLVPFIKQAYDQDHTYTFDALPTIDGSDANDPTEEFTVTQTGAVGLRDALLWLYPGAYALGAAAFLVARALLARDLAASSSSSSPPSSSSSPARAAAAGEGEGAAAPLLPRRRGGGEKGREGGAV